MSNEEAQVLLLVESVRTMKTMDYIPPAAAMIIKLVEETYPQYFG
jgi:hypothetical protein